MRWVLGQENENSRPSCSWWRGPEALSAPGSGWAPGMFGWAAGGEKPPTRSVTALESSIRAATAELAAASQAAQASAAADASSAEGAPGSPPTAPTTPWYKRLTFFASQPQESAASLPSEVAAPENAAPKRSVLWGLKEEPELETAATSGELSQAEIDRLVEERQRAHREAGERMREEQSAERAANRESRRSKAIKAAPSGEARTREPFVREKSPPPKEKPAGLKRTKSTKLLAMQHKRKGELNKGLRGWITELGMRGWKESKLWVASGFQAWLEEYADAQKARQREALIQPLRRRVKRRQTRAACNLWWRVAQALRAREEVPGQLSTVQARAVLTRERLFHAFFYLRRNAKNAHRLRAAMMAGPYGRMLRESVEEWRQRADDQRAAQKRALRGKAMVRDAGRYALTNALTNAITVSDLSRISPSLTSLSISLLPPPSSPPPPCSPDRNADRPSPRR